MDCRLKLLFLIAVSMAAGAVLAGCATGTVGKASLPSPPLDDPDIVVDIYVADKAFNGTTLLADNHRPDRSRIIEVNMRGQVVWQYDLPAHLKPYTNPGFDVERLPNDNILFVLPRKGIYEIDRAGRVIWSYADNQVSHDADRLPNGHTLVVFGANDQMGDAQVKEIDAQGRIVWAWYAKDHFNRPSYNRIDDEGWTHANAVSRLSNGHTLISLRNFDRLVEVDPDGAVVRIIGEGIFIRQHDPQMLADGHILVANHRRPHRAVEIDPQSHAVVWQSRGFAREDAPLRDADRLPNGNTLLTGATRIVEITAAGEIVWQLVLHNAHFRTPRDRPALGFYKAQRIAAP